MLARVLPAHLCSRSRFSPEVVVVRLQPCFIPSFLNVLVRQETAWAGVMTPSFLRPAAR